MRLNIDASVMRTKHYRQQSGAALIVALILLLVLTLLGVSAMNTTGLEEKMAANMQEHHRAYNAAQSGIRHARTIFQTADVSGNSQTGGSLMLGVNVAGTTSGATITGNWIYTGIPPVGTQTGDIEGVTSTQWYYFNVISTGGNQMRNTDADPEADTMDPSNTARVTLDAGIYREAALQNQGNG
jgi:hypothetical protein